MVGLDPKKELLLLSALLLVLSSLLVREAAATGVTMDEPNHMLGAHFFWGGDKVYHVPDLAPLLKIVTGWVPRASMPCCASFSARMRSNAE